MIQISFEDSKFAFTRESSTGLGYWVCVSGKIPGVIGGIHRNIRVPVEFGNELTKLAIAEGCDAASLRASPKEKKEEPKEKGARRTRRATGTRRVSGFIMSLDD